MKHAYLIMAHNNFNVLKTLLKLLDDNRNDIYLHIDKGVKDWDNTIWYDLLDNANLYFVNRVNVFWSTYSHMYALKNLLVEATKTYHSYYHIISGADLPIKSQDQIHTFFSINSKKEFVGFSHSFRKEAAFQKNYLVKFYRNSNKKVRVWAARSNKVLIKIQKFFGIDMSKKLKGEIKKGHDWFSVTHAAALFLIEEEPKFRKYFYWAFCPSEFFAQTVLYNSNFKDSFYNINNENVGAQRYIDWNRGTPYTFKKEDFELLRNSNMMFSRKFMETVDMKIVNELYHYLMTGNQKRI